MLRLFVGLSFLAATVGFALAQSGDSAAGFIVRGVVPASQCPVGMTVQQQGWGGVAWTVSLEDAQQAGSEVGDRVENRTGRSGVRVELQAPRGMNEVELAVFYMAPGGRVLPVPASGFASKPASELKKTFVLTAGDGSAARLGGSLLVGATAGITRVQLIRVRYSDGGEWKTSGAGCFVKPSLFMPVGK